MASITLEPDAVRIRLSPAEKLFGLRRNDPCVAFTEIAGVVVERDGLAAVRGMRAPGLAVPGRVKIGTWRRRGARTFVAVRRGTPAVLLQQKPGADFDGILVGTPVAAEMARRVREAAGLPAAATGEEVQIPSSELSLAGTLLLPPGSGPHPAALIVSGSGPLDRDSNHGRARLGIGRDIAEALAARGVASLRYDRRGVGDSGGSFLAAGFHDNTADAANALAFLGHRSDVAGCFIVGHSEGALHAAAVAGDGAHDDLAGVVLLAPSAKTGEETLVWQTAQIAPTLPAPIRVLLRLLRTDLAAKQAKNVRRLKSTTGAVERIDGRRMNARWHREFIAFDPLPSLGRIRVPVMALTGDKDLQVDPGDLDVVARTVDAQVDVVRVPDLTHVLRRDPGRPSLSAYRKLIRQRTDAQVLETVGEWIQARAR